MLIELSKELGWKNWHTVRDEGIIEIQYWSIGSSNSDKSFRMEPSLG